MRHWKFLKITLLLSTTLLNTYFSLVVFCLISLISKLLVEVNKRRRLKSYVVVEVSVGSSIRLVHKRGLWHNIQRLGWNLVRSNFLNDWCWLACFDWVHKVSYVTRLERFVRNVLTLWFYFWDLERLNQRAIRRRSFNGFNCHFLVGPIELNVVITNLSLLFRTKLNFVWAVGSLILKTLQTEFTHDTCLRQIKTWIGLPSQYWGILFEIEFREWRLC